MTTKHTNDDGLLHVLAYWLGKVDLFLTDKNISFVFDGFIFNKSFVWVLQKWKFDIKLFAW